MRQWCKVSQTRPDERDIINCQSIRINYLERNCGIVVVLEKKINAMFGRSSVSQLFVGIRMDGLTGEIENGAIYVIMKPRVLLRMERIREIWDGEPQPGRTAVGEQLA